MKLSAPIFILKQQAKALARSRAIPRNRALDLIHESALLPVGENGKLSNRRRANR
jgi:hypothetical protein